MSSRLFSPYRIRELEIRNRVFVSPMCQYSAIDGVPNTWHLVHLGARATGGAGLVIAEATSVSPEGRISPFDLGLWSDAQVQAFKPITRFIQEQGSVASVQIAHAGRKASTDAPWNGDKPVDPSQGGWTPIAPSAIAFSPAHPTPREMTLDDIKRVREEFTGAAKRALEAGFQVAEVHAAHGYLLHQFLSPISNRRTDSYGGSFENRARLTMEVAKSIRELWPKGWPVFVRLSATDWVPGGWDADETVRLSQALKDIGIDFIDCTTGGLVPDAKIPAGPGFQVPFAERIRREAGIATGAVGFITDAKQAEAIVAEGQADAVLIARELLRDPHWPLRAAHQLGAEISWPKQYARAKPR